MQAAAALPAARMQEVMEVQRAGSVITSSTKACTVSLSISLPKRRRELNMRASCTVVCTPMHQWLQEDPSKLWMQCENTLISDHYPACNNLETATYMPMPSASSTTACMHKGAYKCSCRRKSTQMPMAHTLLLQPRRTSHTACMRAYTRAKCACHQFIQANTHAQATVKHNEGGLLPRGCECQTAPHTRSRAQRLPGPWGTPPHAHPPKSCRLFHACFAWVLLCVFKIREAAIYPPIWTLRFKQHVAWCVQEQ